MGPTLLFYFFSFLSLSSVSFSLYLLSLLFGFSTRREGVRRERGRRLGVGRSVIGVGGKEKWAWAEPLAAKWRRIDPDLREVVAWAIG